MMRDFDVQTVELPVPFDAAFEYIADPRTLPVWTHAFESVAAGCATLRTSKGSVDVALEVRAARESGTVDWLMTFPDGSLGRAYSRVVERGGRSLYSFVLLAPPVPLAELEGALEEQARTLKQELATLQRALGER